MKSNSELKQMLATDKLNLQAVMEFKDYLEWLTTSNVVDITLSPKMNKNVKETYLKCIRLLDQAVKADTDSESKNYLHQVVKMLDVGWEYIFQQALIELSQEKLQETYDHALDVVKNQAELNKHQTWVETVVVLNELRG